MTGVTGHMGGGRGMTGGPGHGARGLVLDVAGGGVGGKCGGPRLAHADVTPHPGTSGFDRSPSAGVLRVEVFEVSQHMLGTGGRPDHQRRVVPLVELGRHRGSFEHRRM